MSLTTELRPTMGLTEETALDETKRSAGRATAGGGTALDDGKALHAGTTLGGEEALGTAEVPTVTAGTGAGGIVPSHWGMEENVRFGGC
jgi:hypothetical protein